eukprot:tig00000402_g247.t1
MPGPAARTALFLVAKYPLPGACKTRLASGIGPEHAATFARAALLDLLERLAATLSERIALYLYYSGDESRMRELLLELRPELSTRWDLVPQLAGGSLGDRLQAALEHPVASRRASIFIGSDLPDIPRSLLEEADEVVQTAEPKAFLAKACDGGYVLLSLSPACSDKPRSSEVFRDIPWSCEQTGQKQIEALQRAGVPCSLARATYEDVDDKNDLLALADRLDPDSGPQLCPRTYMAVQSIVASLQ